MLLPLVLLWGTLCVFAQKVEFTEFDLQNGLHVILHQDNTAPVITVGVMYDVGGKDLGGDNNPHRTGFAHFFEHLLFEGTENIGRGEWFPIVASQGGSNNANTSPDRTYYYETFPSNSLQTGLWMESERMMHPKIDSIGVETQNEVVKEEKRLRYDNSPYGQFLFVINENVFDKHPYKYSNIGEMEDLDAASLGEFQAYFKKYYVPNNAVLVVAGDIDIDKTKKMVSDYFSAIPRGKDIVRDTPREDPITETKHAEFYDPNIQIPAIIAAYRTPGYTEKDSYVLNMLSTYLSDGKSSKLYKKLVDEKKEALQVAAINFGQRDYGFYALLALPLGETSLETLQKEMDEEIVKVQNELISERDFKKLQNKYENQFVNSNSSIQGIAGSLATYYLLHGDVNLINTELDIYQSITREDLKRVANKYLKPNQRVEIKYLPKNTNE